MAAKDQNTLTDIFERALGDILARVCLDAPPASASTEPDLSGAGAPKVAIAYSGGLDSSVLLHLAADASRRLGITLRALHVHHGLSANANQWSEHCRRECSALGIDFDMRRVAVDGGAGGVEEGAREARYAALGAMCRQHGVRLLLTAHHQDDQAETVLLQLLRGSGVAGLSGMDRMNQAPGLLGDSHLWMARPLLHVDRATLESWAGEHGLAWVEDESNTDASYARNALRHHVAPALRQHFPGFEKRLVRAAEHAQAAHTLMQEVAAADLQACSDAIGLDLMKLSALGEARANNLLRHWMGRHGMRMPSTAWLDQMRLQLLQAKEDARVCITHRDGLIRRFRGHAQIEPRTASAEQATRLDFRWNGEAALPCPAFGGKLMLAEAAQGIDPAWLRGQSLSLRSRSGGERLKLAPNRPNRSLKQHFQALGIPYWQRDKLPLLYAGERLIYAAGIGMDAHCPRSDAGIVFDWLPDSESFT
ncbi:tRNA(Ile)-lysidine synthase [Noviherbaspirillum humi]|uniref:tRNA(Ile)-lysidine synthase n=1 Tax=Noviherbaspirillum humi TaxID=1688639 RepID=A0A239FVE2_9BURK|nr:tRNA lysidine(34) synthetase TilS [Noviherbaspirillum humi]SNS59854.1 tRNA(Ile)-lysidine synthase [Noviherbaspirillum humi]